ncbi:hypothetical protein NQ317_014253 [Molorchus minor]|uniref:Uncharacterized protein n=1 Tax=Molorchus minor TaxID=1323400 RepID=A0ABQ9J6C1_9CUCU|nr:hypothetical protein NQ317_014253 [Molorchus minor]
MPSQEDTMRESTSGSNSKDAMFEPKPKPKMIRVLTVIAYVLSVSMAAILLSIYYIFIWEGQPQIGSRRSSYDMLIDQNDSIGYEGPISSRYISDDRESLVNTSTFSTSTNTYHLDDLRIVNGSEIFYEVDNTTTTMEIQRATNETEIGNN